MLHQVEKQLAVLQPELDPEGWHGTRKIWAALQSTGLDIDDVEPGFVERGPALHQKVPADRASDIMQQRREIREGLRRSRIQQVREAMEALDDDAVRRFERTAVARRTGGSGPRGVPCPRPLLPEDLPPLEAIDGVAEFKAIQQRQMERVQHDQERKAAAICTEFLLGKKRAEEADARIEALNKRLKDYKQERENHWKQKKLEASKAEERRQANVTKAAHERAGYEDELQRKTEDSLANARARRGQHYSTDAMNDKMAKANAKREAAFDQAMELEERTLMELTERQNATEQRLYQRNLEVAEHMENRRQEAQEKFLHKQACVEAMKQEWAENKLKAHKAYVDHLGDARHRCRDVMKERSKSTGDISRKARDKWRTNFDRLQNEKAGRNAELLEREANAANRVENELKPMKYKCGADVFSHVEVKEKTFGDLQQRRFAELKRAQEARTLAMCIAVAERDAKDAAKAQSQAEVAKKRVEAKKEILRYSNEASAIFLKIKSEPNEARVRAAMQSLGFKMPRIGGEDEEEAAAT